MHMQNLAEQTAAAVQFIAESSAQATGSLANRTAEAFTKTEGHLNSLYQDIQRQESSIAQLTQQLEEERKMRQSVEQMAKQNQNMQIRLLSQQLERALSRIDELSTDLAVARSTQD